MTEEQKLTSEQEYYQAQINDLNKKAATLNFQLDQVKASQSVFTNLLAKSISDVASEVLNEEKKSDNTKGGK
tara:strand:- start:644 stop:859 length:216 start_codon:yes stop_codon:yes gene_type:complete